MFTLIPLTCIYYSDDPRKPVTTSVVHATSVELAAHMVGLGVRDTYHGFSVEYVGAV